MNASLHLIGQPGDVVSGPEQQPMMQSWLTETLSMAQEDSLRVLVVLSHQPSETGSGVYVQEVVRELQALGHTPYLLAAHYRPLSNVDIPSLPTGQIYTVIFDDGENSTHADIPFPIPGMSPDMPYMHVDFQSLSRDQLDNYCRVWIARIRSIVKQVRPHVIHVNHLWLLPAIARVAVPWLPIVATSHGTDYKLLLEAPTFAPLVLPGVQCLDAIMSISSDIGRAIIAKFGAHADQVHIIGNGYNEQLFHWQPPESASAFQHDLQARFPDLAPWDKLVLSVGRFADFKGIPYLIRSARFYSQAYNALTLIVGEGTKQTRMQLEQLVQDAGLARRVLLPGKVEHQSVGLLMRQADVFVLPSIDEPFGLVLLEALASGVPSVAADRGGPPFFVPAYLRERGLVSLIKPLQLLHAQHPDPADEERYVDDLATAISLQLARQRSEHERQRIARAVRDQTWQAKVGQVVHIYRSAIQMRRQALMSDA